MAKIEWSDRYSTGIDAIDHDHRQLVEMINTLHQAMMSDQARSNLPEIMRALSDYVGFHFQREEALMEQHRFPGAIQHRQMHEQFSDMVAEYRSKLECGDFAICTSLFVLLQNWLIEHIMIADQELARHIRIASLSDL